MTQTIDHKKSGSDGRTGKSSSHETTLADYLTMFLRGKKTILYCLILVTAVDALYTFTRRPGYESSALVLIDMKGTNAALPFSVDITGAATLNKMTNELEILKSNSLALVVAQNLLEKKTLPPDNKIGIPLIEYRGRGDSMMICTSQRCL